MSQPNASAATFPYNLCLRKRQNQLVDQGQNQMATVGAIAPNTIPQPSDFKLGAVCWDEVFDCQSIEDVHSFGQRCKAYQCVTDEYFKRKYEAVTAYYKEDGIYIDGKQMNGFSAVVQKIRIDENTTDSMLRYIESNYKGVKEIAFDGVDFGKLNFELIKNLLAKLEILEICYCNTYKWNFERLIESCVSLKRIRFFYNTHFVWPVRKNPMLEHLGIHLNGTLGKNQLKTLLEQSPNLRSLEFNAYHLYQDRESILNSNVKLNDLAIFLCKDFKSGVAAFIVFLVELYQRDFYKRLHLCSRIPLSPSQLLALPGLVTLYDFEENADYPILVNIKDIIICNTTWMPISINPTKIVNSFINVEYVFINSANFEILSVLVRRLAKLKNIYIMKFNRNALDICALNMERKKLLGSPKVTIYVGEKTYLASKQTTFDLIEIRRNSSNNIFRPEHSLLRLDDFSV